MDLESLVAGPAQDLLDMSGENVVLTTQDVVGYDDYGDPEYEETTLDTVAEIVTRGSTTFERRVDGIDGDVQAVAWIKANEVSGYGEAYGDAYGSFPLSTGVESEDLGPTHLESETHSFTVYELFDEHNGKYRLHLAE